MGPSAGRLGASTLPPASVFPFLPIAERLKCACKLLALPGNWAGFHVRGWLVGHAEYEAGGEDSVLTSSDQREENEGNQKQNQTPKSWALSVKVRVSPVAGRGRGGVTEPASGSVHGGFVCPALG